MLVINEALSEERVGVAGVSGDIDGEDDDGDDEDDDEEGDKDEEDDDDRDDEAIFKTREKEKKTKTIN